MLRLELDRLSHRDVRQRRMAVRRLFEIDDRAALPAFVEMLEDADAWFADKAVEAVRRWAGDADRNLILKLSSHDREPRRLLSAELAPRLGRPGLDILSGLCNDPDAGVRRTAWKGRLRIDAGALPVAMEAEDHVIRRLAVDRCGDGELLRGALEDAHSRVRDAARRRLTTLGEPLPEAILISRFADPSAAERRALSAALSQVDWAEDAALLDAIRSSADPLFLPTLLRRRRGPAYDALRMDCLGHADPMVVSRVLEHLHGRPVSPEIRDLLPELAASDAALIAATATSLLADIEALEADP